MSPKEKISVGKKIAELEAKNKKLSEALQKMLKMIVNDAERGAIYLSEYKDASEVIEAKEALKDQ